MKEKISIVIPTLNEERYLKRLLDSLRPCQDCIQDITIVDGRSTDGTLEVVRTFAAANGRFKVKSLLSDKRNVGYQRNMGAAAAASPLLLFLDADVVVSSNAALQTLVARFTSGGYATASVRFAPVEKDWRGSLYFTVLYIFHKIMVHLSPYALGACLITTRSTFSKVNGFDPSIAIDEDANYCLRASRCGRFGILPVTILLSTRRFRQYGYFRMGLWYLYIFFRRTFGGEIRRHRVPYDFGNFA